MKINTLKLSKLKLTLGLYPKVESTKESISSYIPSGFKAVCLISADFELAWAFRFSKSISNPIERANKLGLQARMNIPVLLKLCKKYQIPITWASVGHLFLEGCQRVKGVAHPEIKRLPKFENQFWNFNSGDWFKDDPGTDFTTDPAWYCPDLIQKILNSPVGHEIGCHTFSHIDCRDAVCSDDVFLSEISECKKLANKFNIKLKSFVHPGHQIGNLRNLNKEGFTSFRTDYGDSLAFPKQHSSGLWELKNTAGIAYKKGWTAKYHITRYITIIKRAIKYNKICVLWFHPSFDPIIPEVVLPEIFKFIFENKDKIWVTTHDEYINWLSNNLKTG